ncbi:caspase family protein, partial [Escherichia coli]|uniref:caspase family protein n=1 Tax=Escherichia coli TaxID=562 RepID=UPI00190BCD7E
MIGRALLVGVADYLLVEPDLPAAVRHDVADVACALSDPAIGRLHPGMITALLDDGAGVADIRAALEHAARAATADETFLFYFSGHGTRDGEGGREQSWLLPHDADFD